MCSQVSIPGRASPIHYPTTVVLVDQDPVQLYALSVQLPDDLVCRYFLSTGRALHRINSDSDLSNSSSFVYPNAEQPTQRHFVAGFGQNNLDRILANPHRFTEISSVVVGHSVPSANSVEFLEKIRRRAIRRIMLTNAKNEKMAIDAFNGGIIDGFVSQNAVETLNATIRYAQGAYFRSTYSGIDAVEHIRSKFLHDGNFQSLFRSIRDERNIVEHYMVGCPAGVLMLDAEGNALQLAAFSEADLCAQYEVACNRLAPRPLLEALKSRQFVFWYGADGFYTPDCVDWAAHLYPAARAHPSKDYLFALMDDQRRLLTGSAFPFRQYLNDIRQSEFAGLERAASETRFLPRHRSFWPGHV